MWLDLDLTEAHLCKVQSAEGKSKEDLSQECKMLSVDGEVAEQAV